jgi:hypothetical protein
MPGISDFIKRKIIFKALKPFAIAQFSPPRSGSTLVYNLLREIFPRKKIFKVHTLRNMCYELNVVGTYRHPLDCIASSIIRYDKKPTDEEIQRQIKIFNQPLHNLLTAKKMDNILLLRYERFLNDFDYIFDNIEKFFNIRISEEMKLKLTSEYKIENVEKKLSGGGFSDMDKKTQLHGNHISKYKGACGYYNEFFSEDQIDFLKKTYFEILKEFDYE